MRLETHDLPDLRPTTDDPADDVFPGALVCHKDDLRSFGICLGRHWGSNDRPMQCEVLWTVVPWTLNIVTQDIKPTGSPRKLKFTWNPQPLTDKSVFKW